MVLDISIFEIYFWQHRQDFTRDSFRNQKKTLRDSNFKSTLFRDEYCWSTDHPASILLEEKQFTCGDTRRRHII